MAGSYFELLTEQEGLPTKPFDPVEELKRLRRELTLRSHLHEPPAEEVAEPPTVQIETVQIEVIQANVVPKNAVPPTAVPSTAVSPAAEPPTAEPIPAEPISMGAVIQKAGETKKTLTILQRSRLRTRPSRKDMFRGNRKPQFQRQTPSVVARYLTTPQEGTLESVNAGLMSLGIIGVIFGVLCVFRGLESDLTIGSLVCATGAAIVVIGLGGRFLASRSELAR